MTMNRKQLTDDEMEALSRLLLKFGGSLECSFVSSEVGNTRKYVNDEIVQRRQESEDAQEAARVDRELNE